MRSTMAYFITFYVITMLPIPLYGSTVESRPVSSSKYIVVGTLQTTPQHAHVLHHRGTVRAGRGLGRPSAVVAAGGRSCLDVGVVPVEADKDTVLDAAKAESNVTQHTEIKQIVKEIYVPGRLVNVVP